MHVQDQAVHPYSINECKNPRILFSTCRETTNSTKKFHQVKHNVKLKLLAVHTI